MLSKCLGRMLPACGTANQFTAAVRNQSSGPTRSKKSQIFPERNRASGEQTYEASGNNSSTIVWKNSGFAKLGIYDAPDMPIEEKAAQEAHKAKIIEEAARGGIRTSGEGEKKKGKGFDFLEIGDDLMDLVREFQKDNQKTLAETPADKASKKASETEKKSHIFPQFLFRPSDADFAADNVVSSQWRDYRNSPPEDVEEADEVVQNLATCPLTGRPLSELTPGELRRVEIFDHEFIRHQSTMRYRLFGAYSRFIFDKFPQRAHIKRMKSHTANVQTTAPVNINYLLPQKARSEEFRYRGKPLQCDLSLPGAIVDYKNTRLLSRYLSEEGRILPRRKTGLSAKMQRQVTNAIKRARQAHLIPYTSKPWRAYPENSYMHYMGKMADHEVYSVGEQTRSKYADLRDALRQKEAQSKLDNAKNTAKASLGWV